MILVLNTHTQFWGVDIQKPEIQTIIIIQKGSKNGISRRYGNNMHNKWALYSSESIKGLYTNLDYIISHDNKMKLTTIITQK